MRKLKFRPKFDDACDALSLDSEQILVLPESEWGIIKRCLKKNNEKFSFSGFFSKNKDHITMIEFYRHFRKAMRRHEDYSDSEIEDAYSECCELIGLDEISIFTKDQIERLVTRSINRGEIEQKYGDEIRNYLFSFAYDNFQPEHIPPSKEMDTFVYDERLRNDIKKIYLLSQNELEAKIIANIEKRLDILQDGFRNSLASLDKEIKKLVAGEQAQFSQLNNEIDHKFKSLTTQLRQNLLDEIRSVVEKTNRSETNISNSFEKLLGNHFDQLKIDLQTSQLSQSDFEAKIASSISNMLNSLQKEFHNSLATLAENIQRFDIQRQNQGPDVLELNNRFPVLFKQLRHNLLEELKNVAEKNSKNEVNILSGLIKRQFIQLKADLYANQSPQMNTKIKFDNQEHRKFVLSLFDELLDFQQQLIDHRKEYEERVPRKDDALSDLPDDLHGLCEDFSDTLQHFDLKPLWPHQGEKVDTRQHNIMDRIRLDNQNYEPGTIAEIIEPGYVWHGELIKQAKVSIYVPK